MSGKINSSLLNMHFVALVGALVMALLISAVGSDAFASEITRQQSIVSCELPRRPSSVVKFLQLVAGETRIGTAVWYDDPATPRRADYLEIYDAQGGLVAVAWFDRFGIERVAMDRAFIEGKERLEGLFVAVVDGDLM